MKIYHILEDIIFYFMILIEKETFKSISLVYIT